MLFTFLVEFVSALILWFILKKALKTINPYTILSVCLLVALIVGFVAAYRGIGFEITQNYLESINNQKIEATGENITLEEQNVLKEELFRTEEFKKARLISSAKTSLYPFVIVLLSMLFLSRKTVKNFRKLDKEN